MLWSWCRSCFVSLVCIAEDRGQKEKEKVEGKGAYLLFPAHGSHTVLCWIDIDIHTCVTCPVVVGIFFMVPHVRAFCAGGW